MFQPLSLQSVSLSAVWLRTLNPPPKCQQCQHFVLEPPSPKHADVILEHFHGGNSTILLYKPFCIMIVPVGSLPISLVGVLTCKRGVSSQLSLVGLRPWLAQGEPRDSSARLHGVTTSIEGTSSTFRLGVGLLGCGETTIASSSAVSSLNVDDSNSVFYLK